MAEQRIRHQVELTELHKARGELAQTVIDLNKTLQIKEQEQQEDRIMISRYKGDIATLSRRCNTLENELEEMQHNYQLLQDEHSVLQLTYSSLEERMQKTEHENRELVERWMGSKAAEADRVNKHNDMEERYRKILSKLKRKLEQLKRNSRTSELEEFVEVNILNEKTEVVPIRSPSPTLDRTPADGESGNDDSCYDSQLTNDLQQLLFETREAETSVRYITSPSLSDFQQKEYCNLSENKEDTLNMDADTELKDHEQGRIGSSQILHYDHTKGIVTIGGVFPALLQQETIEENRGVTEDNS
ncbi:autophagy-related protein 16-like isoform X2 [Protopterus annectens]|nr:autophagy-related protein 16-like isoform X2 [Protopterus annectens]